MTRQQALQLVQKYVKNANSVKHMLATEAIMRALARRFGENEEIWGLAGLLHDLDMEINDYRANPAKHGLIAAEILEKAGFKRPKRSSKRLRSFCRITGLREDS